MENTGEVTQQQQEYVNQLRQAYQEAYSRTEIPSIQNILAYCGPSTAMQFSQHFNQFPQYIGNGVSITWMPPQTPILSDTNILTNTPPTTPHDDTPTFAEMLQNSFTPAAGYVPVQPCFLCQKQFNDTESLTDHLRMHLNELQKDPSVLFCDLCNSELHSTKELYLHYKRVHEGCSLNNEGLKKKVNKKKSSTDELKNNPKSFICPICHESFDRRYNQVAHMKLAHPKGNADAALQSQQQNLKNSRASTKVLSTTEWNAIASTATRAEESSEHGLVPISEYREGPPCNKKYALRSQFFNSELHLENDLFK